MLLCLLLNLDIGIGFVMENWLFYPENIGKNTPVFIIRRIWFKWPLSDQLGSNYDELEAFIGPEISLDVCYALDTPILIFLDLLTM